MFKRLLQDFIERVVRDKRGFINIGGGYDSSKEKSTLEAKSRKETAPSEFVKAPEFPEAEQSRRKWWDLLQGWGGQYEMAPVGATAISPGQMASFGAMVPDWGQIWENAQRKVQQYFWGSPTDPGLIGKVKASTSARGVAESPAREKMIGRMGATEANVMSDMATQLMTKQAEFGEAGRLNYLANLAQLSGYQPTGTWYTPWQTTEESQTATGRKSGWSVDAKTGDLLGDLAEIKGVFGKKKTTT